MVDSGPREGDMREPIDPVLELARKREHLLTDSGQSDDGIVGGRDLVNEACGVAEEIGRTVATSLAGVVVQLGVLADSLESNSTPIAKSPDECERTLIANMITT